MADCEQLSARVRSSKSRSSFSVEQVLQLERVFEGQKYLGSRDIQRIAEQLQMTETQVRIEVFFAIGYQESWFGLAFGCSNYFTSFKVLVRDTFNHVVLDG